MTAGSLFRALALAGAASLVLASAARAETLLIAVPSDAAAPAAVAAAPADDGAAFAAAPNVADPAPAAPGFDRAIEVRADGALPPAAPRSGWRTFLSSVVQAGAEFTRR